MFEKASRMKLRFVCGKGDVSVEELWDLNLTTLDNIAKSVKREMVGEEEESFIPNKNKKQSNNSLRLDILKHIIATKVDEDNKKSDRAKRLAELAQLKELAAAKQNEKLASQSLDDILKQIQAMESLV